MGKMTLWGVGLKILLPSYFLLIVLFLLPVKIDIAGMLNVPEASIFMASLPLMCTGIILLAITNVQIKKNLKENRLITTGLFSLVRNPMYAAHIYFLLPGICLLTDNAITLLSVLCAIIIFNSLIRHEETALLENFGDAYIEYRDNVNRLIPKITVRPPN